MLSQFFVAGHYDRTVIRANTMEMADIDVAAVAPGQGNDAVTCDCFPRGNFDKALAREGIGCAFCSRT